MGMNPVLIGLIFAIPFSTAANAGKKPVSDLECDGCVNTPELADGAVTSEKISSDLIELINRLNDRIDALESAPKPYVFIDGNDNVIGRVFSASTTRSVEGYSFSFSLDDGAIGRADPFLEAPQQAHYLLFESEDCSGLYIPQNGITPGMVSVMVYRDEPGGGVINEILSYVPLGADPIAVTAYSQMFNSSCSPIEGGRSVEIYEELPNDPTVTGISYPSTMLALPTPIRIE